MKKIIMLIVFSVGCNDPGNFVNGSEFFDSINIDNNDDMGDFYGDGKNIDEKDENNGATDEIFVENSQENADTEMESVDDIDSDVERDALVDTDNKEHSYERSDSETNFDTDADANLSGGADMDVSSDKHTEFDVDAGEDSGVIQTEEGYSPTTDDGNFDTDTNHDAETDFATKEESGENGFLTQAAYIGDCYDGNIWVDDQDGMDSLSALECVIGDLNISYTSDVVEINLPHLVRVYGNFTITYNQTLENIDIPELAYVQGPLLVTMNEFLPTCEGYELVAAAKSREGLSSGYLVSGNAMDGCTQPWECYQWSVTISTQEDLDKFSMVSCFKKTLYVETETLEEVSFPALVRLGNKLVIRNSPSIEIIDFPVLKYARGIQITDNESLSNCNVVEVISAAVEREEEGGYLGDIVIEGNLDDGCYY